LYNPQGLPVSSFHFVVLATSSDEEMVSHSTTEKMKFCCQPVTNPSKYNGCTVSEVFIRLKILNNLTMTVINTGNWLTTQFLSSELECLPQNYF
jgi:hypothetical protein